MNTSCASARPEALYSKVGRQPRPIGFLSAGGLGSLRLIAILPLCVTSILCAQVPAPAPNRVLRLTDGTSHVELPPNIFDGLEQATVEGWFRWENLDGTDRFFDFGAKDLETYVRNEGPQMNFLIAAPGGVRHRIEVAGLLGEGEWCHIAATTGPGGAKLYFNGTLVGEHPYTGSLSGIIGTHNYLGKSNYRAVTSSSRGAMDEVRVWDHERTPEQIRASLFKTLDGTEKGLAGYWNFDEGDARDLSPGKHDGTPEGAPQFVEEALPAAGSLRSVATARLAGKVTVPDGDAADLDVVVREGARRLARLRTDRNGEFRTTVVTGTEPIEVYVLDGSLGAGEAGLALNPGEERRVDLTLQPTQLAGRTLATDGTPLPALTVELATSADAVEALASVVTDAEGAFDFGARPPGRYLLRALAPGGRVVHDEDNPLALDWGTVLTGIAFTVPDAAMAAPPAGAPPVGLALHCSGADSFVRLPDNLFEGVEEATIEAWVRWEDYGNNARPWDFGGPGNHAYLTPGNDPGRLLFRIDGADGVRHRIEAPGIPRLADWIHVAAVTGKEGVRIYANGNLVATGAHTGSLGTLGTAGNYLGRRAESAAQGLKGELDEVRIWKTARTVGEIRANLSTALTGEEPGLLALWNFDDPEAPGRDASPNGHHGQLIGAATAISAASVAVAASPPNKVLELDGNNSFVELPPHAFDAFTEVTVEGWVKWESFRNWSRFFDFGKPGRAFLVGQLNESSDLAFHVWPDPSGYLELKVPDVLKTGDWYHVAAVADQEGLRLLVNGVRAAESAWTAPLRGLGGEIIGLHEPATPVRPLASGDHQYLGRSNWQDDSPTGKDADFHGQMDEVRVWNVARSDELIRENLSLKLEGTEPGLVALWNFEDEANPGRDATTSGIHGTLHGAAKAVDAPQPGWKRPGADLEGQRALRMDGRDDGFAVPKRFTEVSDTFTMEFWALPTLARGQTGSVNPGLSGQRYVLSPSHGTNELGGDPHAGSGVSVGLDGIAVVEHAANYMPLVIDVPLDLKDWVHVAVVYRDKVPSLYLNGNLVATGARSTHTVHPSPPNSSDRGRFGGMIDEVRVWKTARSGEEILGNLSTNLTGTEPGLVGLWNFDDPDQPGRDHSSGGFHGSLTGRAQTVRAAAPVDVDPLSLFPVLQLSGDGGFLALPRGLFKNLGVATVECWARWDTLNDQGHVFEFDAAQRIKLVNNARSSDLLLMAAAMAGGESESITRKGSLSVKRWHHLAAVFGPEGMTLYQDGLLAGTAPYAAGLALTGIGSRNSIGGCTVNPESSFRGMIADFRLWRTARTPEQIQANMLASLAGTEEGLAGLWNFRDRSQPGRDATPSGNHAEVVGSVAVVNAQRPAGVVAGFVTNTTGKRLGGAEVVLTQDGIEVVRATSGADGGYFLSFAANSRPYDLKVTLDTLGVIHTGMAFGADFQNLDLVLGDSLRFSGTVTGADGLPRGGVKVEAIRAGEDRAAARVLTDARGVFAIRSIPNGTYRIRAAGPAGAVLLEDGREFDVSADSQPVTDAALQLSAPEPAPEPPAESANHLLALDGSSGYMELPPHIFDSLAAATIEGWVNWTSLRGWSRFFDFGEDNRQLFLALRDSSGLAFQGGSYRTRLEIDADVTAGEWFHLAAVAGEGGMRLYVNGTLVGSRSAQASPATASTGNYNLIGRSNPGTIHFHGQMDEIRVWVTPRTEEEIRAHMFRRLSGSENGLAGLWNFEDPDAPGRDATPNGFDGVLKGGAEVVPGKMPASPADVTVWASLSGAVTDADGRALREINLRLAQGTRTVETLSDAGGQYRIAVPSGAEPWTLTARTDEWSSAPMEVILDEGEVTWNVRLRDSALISGRVLALDDTPMPTVVIQAVPVEDDAGNPEQPGLRAEFYRMEGLAGFPVLNGSEIPDLTRADPNVDFALKADSIAGAPFNNRLYARWSGVLRIRAAAEFTFFLAGNDAARLSIDGRPVVSSTSLGVSGTTTLDEIEKSGSVALGEGDHEILVEFYNRGGRDGCRLSWSGANLTKEVIPAAVFFHRPATPELAAAITDAKGKFRFPKVLPGPYTLRAHVPGGFAELPDGRVVTVEKDNPQANLDFRLAPFKPGRWKHYSHLDGMAGGAVVRVFEATDGALWIGTSKGISRFDGQKFLTLPESWVSPDSPMMSIAEAPAGVLWFGTGSGLYRYESDHPNRKPKRFGKEEGLPEDSLTTPVAKDRNGRLWVGTERGLFWFDPSAPETDGKAFRNIYPADRLTVKDAGPGAHHGQLMGGATLAPGEIPGFADAPSANHVLRLDGKDSYVDLGPEAPVLSAPFTMEAWIRPERTDRWSAFLGGIGIPDEEAEFRNASAALRAPSFYVRPGGALHGGFGTGTEWHNFQTAEGILRSGAWEHVAYSYNGENLRVYVNGTLAHTQPETGIPMAEPVRWIGRVNSFFSGEIDEVRLWSTVRSEEEIREAMGRRLTGREPGLAASWDFESTEQIRIDAAFPEEEILSLHAASDGAVWFGTPGGVSKFDGRSITRFTESDGLPGLPGIMSIGEARDGTLWFGTSDAVARLNPAVEGAAPTFSVLTPRDGLMAGLVMGAAADPREGMWFATMGSTTGSPEALRESRGLSYFDGKSFIAFGVTDGLGDPDNSGVLCVFPDSHGGIWVGTARGLSHYDYQSFAGFGEAEGMDIGKIADIAATQDGNVWFLTEGTSAKLSRFDGQRLIKMTRDDGVIGSRLSRLYVDTDGSLLVSDWLTDSIRFDPAVAPNEPPHFEIFDSGGGASAMVRAATGELWLAADRGLRIRGESGTVEQRVTGARLTARGSDGSLWFAGNEGVWHYRDSDFFQFTRQHGLPSTAISGMHALPDGGLLVTSASGGAAIREGEAFVPWPSETSRLSGVPCHDITRDANGHTWVATDEGVFRTDGTASIMLTERDGLPENHARRVYTVGDDQIWIGLRNHGAVRYRPAKLTPHAPVVSVLTGREEDSGATRSVTAGQRATFTFNAIEFYTPVEKRQYRWQLYEGSRDEKELEAGWSRPATDAQLEKTFEEPGEWTMAVQFIDRDLNYSPPTLANLHVILPWHANARIMVPAGAGVAGLLGWALFARLLYARKRREAERLRGQMLEQETEARHTLEAKNQELEEARAAAEKAKSEADEANKAKSSFLANMSHELRTPMNAIIGYSEMLQEEAEDLDQKGFIPDLQKIHGAGQHLLGLINDILDLSKVEAGKMTLYLEEFDVAKMVGEVSATVQPLVSKNGNTLVIECPAEVGVMKADVTKVRQTLFNLLSNASKFTEKGTITLHVSLNSQLSTLNFRVADTGIGMTPEQMSGLFQAFSQADASTTRKYGGTGLGLAISRKFCQMMGGDITVESEPGQGTAFTVTLPVTVREPGDETDGTNKAYESHSTQKPHPADPAASTVLVIDDDPAVRDLMERTLTKDGYRVITAADGARGLALAKELLPAVITLDVMMPGMDGWAVLTALKADPATAGIPVVMLTIVDDKHMGFALGAADYFTKPIDWPRLSALLKRHRRTDGPHTVLIIEDDADTRDMLRRGMEKDGWTTVTAEHARHGLERLSEGIPSLILLDLMMPEMDGFEFMQELRRRDDCRHLPVIVITAMDLTAADHARLNNQVARIIQKSPAGTDQLLTEVRSLLAQHGGWHI